MKQDAKGKLGEGNAASAGRLGQTIADAALAKGEEQQFWLEYQQLREGVAEERRLWLFRGRSWTPYRPFRCGLEMCGASLCSCKSRNRNVAAYVSYSTEIAGRTVRCENCHRRDIHLAYKNSPPPSSTEGDDLDKAPALGSDPREPLDSGPFSGGIG